MSAFNVEEYFNLNLKKDNRKCDKCGCIETFDNLILAYKDKDNKVLLCDDCLLDYNFID